MNIFGVVVFVMAYLIASALTLYILEKKARKEERILEVRKSINAAIGPIVRGLIKVVFVIVLFYIQFKLDFHYAVIYGIFGGICMGLMAYFFEPKTKKTKSILISNNLKTLGIQFVLIAINWVLIWTESELSISVFSVCTLPIYFLAGFLFLRPIAKRDYLSVIGLFALLFVNAIVVVINSNAMIVPAVVNPVCGWAFEGNVENLILPQDMTCLILSFVPSLFMFLGIVVKKIVLTHKVSDATFQ